MKSMDSKDLEKAASMLRVVAHPVRISIINLLVKNDRLSVKGIQAKLGVTQSMTSQHLSALRSIDVLDFEKNANVCNYFIKNKYVLKLLECVEKCASNY